MALFFLFFITSFLWASEPPCSEFEFLVRAHEVQAYQRKDGTQVSSASKGDFCREYFIGTKSWVKGFRDSPLQHWPYPEKFKKWTKLEKEIILKIISNWPDIYQNWKGAVINRAEKSIFKDNPGASLPKANAIILYDNFFKQKNREAILAHELANIHMLQLNPAKMKAILQLSGWDISSTLKPKWTGEASPLKEDSKVNPGEDLSNHIEDYLYSPKDLIRTRPQIYTLLRDLLGPDFKLKDQK